VRHLANAVEERYGDDQEATIRAVVRSFAKELQLPTSEADGYFCHNQAQPGAPGDVFAFASLRQDRG